MSPSPTNTARSPYTGDQPSTGAPPAPPGSKATCKTSNILPNQPYNGPTKTGVGPPLGTPTVAPLTIPTGYTPSTAPVDSGKGAGAGDGRNLQLLSLSQAGTQANSSTNPLFRLTYANALGLGTAGDSRAPSPPLYNPFNGANR